MSPPVPGNHEGDLFIERFYISGERLLGAIVAGTTETNQSLILQKLRNSDFSDFQICGIVEEVLNASVSMACSFFF